MKSFEKQIQKQWVLQNNLSLQKRKFDKLQKEVKKIQQAVADLLSSDD